jgi:hypothetical protein
MVGKIAKEEILMYITRMYYFCNETRFSFNGGAGVFTAPIRYRYWTRPLDWARECGKKIPL